MGREDAVARPKSQEYLRVLNQILQIRSDNPLNSLQNHLQEIFQREQGGLSDYGSFVERYACFVTAMHIHSSIRLSPTGGRLNLCATVQHCSGRGIKPAFKPNTLLFLGTRSNDVQVSVFVDVREFGEEAKKITDGGIPVVRLNTLNECKRLHGNVRKLPREYVVRSRESMRDWGFPFCRNIHVKGKLGARIPAMRKRLPTRIPLDQLECQVIKGGPHLVNHFSDQNTNFSGRRFRNVQLLFALRLQDDFVRLTSGINSDATLYSSEVFRSPDELKFRRFNASDHYDKEYYHRMW